MSGNKKIVIGDIEKQKLLEKTGVINFKNRLLLVLEGMSGNAFAKKVGMSEAVIRDYLSGKTYPSLNRLAIISQKCEIPIEWLATGKGDCRLSSNNEAKGTVHIPVYQSHMEKEFEENGSSSKPTINTLPFDLSWIRHHGFNVKDLNIYWAKGDSMSPTISDYDAIVINTANIIPFDGYIYIVQYGDTLSIKRIQNHGRYLLLLSDNEKYPTIKIDKTDHDIDFDIIGRVVYILKDLS